MEDVQRDTEGSRSMSVEAHGDCADALEMNALDQAREFFGADIRLKVNRDYVVGRADEQGQRRALILVREI